MARPSYPSAALLVIALLCCSEVLALQPVEHSRGQLKTAGRRREWEEQRVGGHFKPQPQFQSLYNTIPAAANSSSIFNVVDFGAKGDGVTDNVATFQKALNAASAGGVVFVPTGQYLFKTNTTVVVPRGVTLQGTFRTVVSHHVASGKPVDAGSVLLVTAGRGGEDGCFIQLSEDSTISGLVIYYPDQEPTQVPKPYPWSVCMSGNNPAVTDLECLNCWNAIKAVHAARHYIARVQGQPMNMGIFVDETYDIGRVEDVHFNLMYSKDKSYLSWQLLHGRSFVFARTDWEYVFNTFSLGYAIAYHFVESDQGICNGNFLGLGADMAFNASVQVEAAKSHGILIVNGEFTAFDNPKFGQQYADPAQVVVTSSNTGGVSFVNSAFWGPSNQIAKLDGSGDTLFSDCIFNAWDHDKKGSHAIEVKGANGSLIVRGCDFQHDGAQINLGKKLKKAIILGNTFEGATRISGKAANTQIGLNADG